MNKYQEAILEIKKMNCNITKDWNCEICTHQKVCAYYLPCKTLQELVDKETPKKVLNKHTEKTREYYNEDSFGYIETKEGKCSTCNRDYLDNDLHIYCPQCGQRLDWSDENEKEG